MRASVVIFPISGPVVDTAEGASGMEKPAAAMRDLIGSVSRTSKRRLTVPGVALNSPRREDKIQGLIQRVHEPTRWPDGRMLVLEDNSTLLDTARRIAIALGERPSDERGLRVVLFVGSMTSISAASDAPLLIDRALAALEGLRSGVKVMTSDGSILQVDHASYDRENGKIIQRPSA